MKIVVWEIVKRWVCLWTCPIDQALMVLWFCCCWYCCLFGSLCRLCCFFGFLTLLVDIALA